MQELRYNPVTGDWVIVAPERGARPHRRLAGTSRTDGPALDPTCPFCPGNEGETPDELYRRPKSSEEPWRIRVVPNRYPALADGPAEEFRGPGGTDRARPAVGRHEVIIETAHHARRFTELDDRAVTEVMETYRRRLVAACEDPRVEHVIIFRNHGRGAGASLSHPHAQLLGLPFVPPSVARRVELAASHDRSGSGDLLHELLEEELHQGDRIVEVVEDYAIFVPHAAAHPYETWIVPRSPVGPFGGADVETLTRAGRVLRRALAVQERALDGPDYNCILQLPPVNETSASYPWHFQVIPRLGRVAGFEIGAGVQISETAPERAAAELRAAT